jgi:hypothetical protein
MDHGRGGGGGWSLLVLPAALVFSTVLAAYGDLAMDLRLVLAGSIAGLAVVALLHRPLGRVMGAALAAADVPGPGSRAAHLRAASAFAPTGACLLLAMAPLVPLAWSFAWYVSPVPALALLGAFLALGYRAYRTATGPVGGVKDGVGRQLSRQQRRMRERYGRG